MSLRTLCAALCALTTILVLAPAAGAQSRDVQRAKAEAGILDSPDGSVETSFGTLRIVRPEVVAARFDQRIAFELDLDRDVSAGSVRIALPPRWRARPSSGIRATTPPRLTRTARGARLGRSSRDVELDLDGASAGSTVRAEVTDHGIPAGEYRLAVTVTDEAGEKQRVDALEMRLYAPSRESSDPENPWEDVKAINVTNNASTESETYVTIAPGNPQRILVGVNGGGGYNAWITNDGGTTWTKRAVPTTADVPGNAANDTLAVCCDPMSAADATGNIWYGGLSTGANSRIHVSRMAAGTNTFVNTVGLPRRTSGTQDKPMMTIDNKSSSPTFGRLYVVWNEPGSGLNIVVSMCDTRVSGALDAARCDNADNWTPPVSVTKATGSVIYGDVAVGADGKVYVTWWDFSNTNAILGATCDPQATACSNASGWTTASTVARLDSTGGAPVPFACPIMAQPGGRAGPSPGIETDISGTASEGTVYVVWGDLRPSSGASRCSDNAQPAATHLTWDSFVSAASNQLPGGDAVSASAGRRLLADGEGGGQTNSDEWFPWLAADQTTGIAYAGFYSTRSDSTRRTTRFYVRGVNPLEQLGELQEASASASDYSTAACCNFGNDYGDYSGIDANGGVVVPAWSDKLAGADGEAMINIMAPPAPVPAPVLAMKSLALVDPAPGGDGDNVAEPGETLNLSVPVQNEGDAQASSTTGTLTTADPNLTVLDASASYGSIAVSALANQDAPYQVKLAKTTPCGAAIAIDIAVAATETAGAQSYTFPVGAAEARNATGLPISIPESPTGPGVNSTLTVPAGSGAITDLDIGLTIVHPWVGDVEVTLTHNGTTIVLVDQPGGANNDADNFTSTIFDDEASSSISSAAAPFTGRFQPVQALSAFDGMALDGTWTLNVKDVYVDSSNGSLTAWSMPKHACAVSPRATIAGPASAHTGQEIQLDASGSTDLDGAISSFAWDLDNDGQFDDATGAQAPATFGTTGSKTVKVRVTDDGGLTGEATKTVDVTAPATGTSPGPGPGTATGPGTGTGIVTPRIPDPIAVLLKPRARVKVSKGVFRLAIGGCSGCRGTIVIESAKKLRAKRGARARKIRLARLKFDLGATGFSTLSGKLSKSNQALLKRLGRIPAVVTFAVTGPTGKVATSTGKLTLIR